MSAAVMVAEGCPATVSAAEEDRSTCEGPCRRRAQQGPSRVSGWIKGSRLGKRRWRCRRPCYGGNGSANKLTFGSVSAPTAGRYTVVVHYSDNDRSGTGNYNTNVESRTADMSVNGGTATTLTFRNTYSWNDYWALPTTVSLTAGTNTLAFSNSSGYAPDIDYIEVAPVLG